ncbi:hypothetical protein HZH68_017011 [Vespula germanica]|uniref:Uncharacterized protein n=2 Tax=Vespula TaxID=7451 RepID=A0A834J0N1_VESGE|nr:hypothetical protein HZH68_017011 [Vespula germanica]KAF7387628.1 hypothetical protein H0235_018350 [Vespula pensylvanica]
MVVGRGGRRKKKANATHRARQYEEKSNALLHKEPLSPRRVARWLLPRRHPIPVPFQLLLPPPGRPPPPT